MRALLLVAAILAAGCLDLAAPPAAPAPGPASPSALVAHRGGALVDVPGDLAGVVARLLPVGHQGGEPSVGVAADGTLFLAGALPDVGPEDFVARGVEMLRSRDGGATWELVGDPATNARTNADPWMWLDPATDRVFHVPLYIVCSWATWSDDLGETWSANPVAGCPPTQHDHQKLTGGPPPAGVATRGYPNVVYYAYNSLVGSLVVARAPVPLPRLGTLVSVSLDGGQTFDAGRIVHANDACHVGVNGPVAVGPDGTAYLPKPTCDGLSVVVSRDAFATWETAEITDAGSLDDFAFDPDVAIDAAGNAYAVWPGRDGLVYLSRSTDGGATWSPSVRVTPPGVNLTVYSVAIGGAPGEVSIAYLGTDADPSAWETRASSVADNATTVWHLYLTTTRDALAASPTFTTARLTPPDDPVQIGCIWMRGGRSDCRNLLDFLDLQRDAAGRLYLAYTDGCAACASAEESRRSDLVLAVIDRALAAAALPGADAAGGWRAPAAPNRVRLPDVGPPEFK